MNRAFVVVALGLPWLVVFFVPAFVAELFCFGRNGAASASTTYSGVFLGGLR